MDVINKIEIKKENLEPIKEIVNNNSEHEVNNNEIEEETETENGPKENPFLKNFQLRKTNSIYW